jgi:hypothetical protein
MNQDQASQTWRGLVHYFDPESSAELDQTKNLFGISLAGRELFAEFLPEKQHLALHAVICRWPGKYDPDQFESLKQRSTPDCMGGGALTYRQDSHHLFLSRYYSESPEIPQLLNDVQALTAASSNWDEKIVDCVFFADNPH